MKRLKFVRLLLLMFLLVWRAAGEPAAVSPARHIDRQAVVSRHNVNLSQVNTRMVLQVGNGDFAFSADVTGLQTFGGYTLSNWGWHEEPLPAGLTPADRQRTEFTSHGRKRYYLAPHRQPELAQWLNDNPHRAHLGRLRLARVSALEAPWKPEDFGHIRQTLDLWRGLLVSEYELAGRPVRVETVCHAGQDAVAVRIVSPLIAEGVLGVVLDFPYPTPKGPDWNSPDRHQTTLLRTLDHRADFRHQADATTNHLALVWSEGAALQVPPSGTAPHAYRVAAKGQDTLTIVCAYSARFAPEELPSFAQTRATAEKMWLNYWQSGAAIDLSGSQDSRWRELERRIVLSQYVMRVNSAGSMPPPEIGLAGIDVWRSKFHLEMTAWHGVHYLLWGRPDCVQGWVRWLQEVGLPAAKREAEAEGWKGAKWLKTPDPFGRWESWDHGPNRVTQNAHLFFWAELFYRSNPSRVTLETWKEMLFETATMMADFVAWDEKSGRYILGPPVMSGAEGNSGFVSWNSTSELNYWAMSLEIAQHWRERLGLTREPNWDHILKHLSRPPIVDGVYIDAESHPAVWNQFTPGRFIRPAWMEVYGCIRGPLIAPAVMEATYERVSREILAREWKGNLWGCDYPMMAMTAARLGRTKEAVDWLLSPMRLNQYTPNGLCAGWYLPGNGGLLWAMAMMAAGWDGAPDRATPGFPSDGTWVVKWEGLQRAP